MADNLDYVADDQTIITFDCEGTHVTYDTLFDDVVYEDNEDASLYEPDI